MESPKKSLGQHWLQDEATLKSIVDSADLDQNDTVLEVGPGTGSLTKHLLPKVKKVIAVEKDENLADSLKGRTLKGQLEVFTGDILKFDLTKLPADYKVVANIPYYLTSNLLRLLCESNNPPSSMTLLVQKEVAERICAKQGQMSILAVSVQLYYRCSLEQVVPAGLFNPPPKVDSQVVMLKRRPQSLFPDLDTAKFFRIVKAGFSERRKKLRSSLAGSLNISKSAADDLLKRVGINPNLRPQDLSLEDWYKLYKRIQDTGYRYC